MNLNDALMAFTRQNDNECERDAAPSKSYADTRDPTFQNSKFTPTKSICSATSDNGLVNRCFARRMKNVRKIFHSDQFSAQYCGPIRILLMKKANANSTNASRRENKSVL